MKLKPGQYTPVIPIINRPRISPRVHDRQADCEGAGRPKDLNDHACSRPSPAIARSPRAVLKAAYYESLRDDAKVTNYYADEVLKNLGAAK